MREVEWLSIHEIVRRTDHDRNTVRRALRREGPPRYAPGRRRPSQSLAPGGLGTAVGPGVDCSYRDGRWVLSGQ